MKARVMCTLVALAITATTVSAQLTPTLAPPINIDLGFGGGVSIPSGDLSNGDNTGYHGLVKARLHGFMPLSVLASGMYNRLPNKVGSESDYQWMIGAGLEYPLPMPMVKPYFGVDLMYNVLSNTGANATSVNRGGLGFGAGVEFSVPAFGSFDASLKYQLINVTGKNTNEPTYAQIAGSVAIMFGVLQ